jgi:hypothetical protein
VEGFQPLNRSNSVHDEVTAEMPRISASHQDVIQYNSVFDYSFTMAAHLYPLSAIPWLRKLLTGDVGSSEFFIEDVPLAMNSNVLVSVPDPFKISCCQWFQTDANEESWKTEMEERWSENYHLPSACLLHQ